MSHRAQMLSVLTKAAEKIRDPESWTQHATARDFRGRRVPSRHPSACRWCAISAVLTVAGSEEVKENVLDLLDEFAVQLYARKLLYVNDELGHEAVMAVFRAAITHLGGSGQRVLE